MTRIRRLAAAGDQFFGALTDTATHAFAQLGFCHQLFDDLLFGDSMSRMQLLQRLSGLITSHHSVSDCS